MRLLAQLTRQVAIVQYPTLSRSTVRHVELVTLEPTRLLLVLILSTGRVEQRVVELPEGLDEEKFGTFRLAVNRAVMGEQHRRRRREARARAGRFRADRPARCSP